MPETPANRELLKYFMQQTNERFDRIEEASTTRFDRLDAALSEMNTFKVRTIVHTRWMAALVSGLVSLVGFGLSIGVELYLQRQARQALLDAAHAQKTPSAASRAEKTIPTPPSENTS